MRTYGWIEARVRTQLRSLKYVQAQNKCACRLRSPRRATMSAIMHYQKDYFLTGDERKLKPMILKDIADEIEMDVSTVSRVANSKYVDTPYGIFELKSFFTEGYTLESGQSVSTKAIKDLLNQLIEKEDKGNPLTDTELADQLKVEGYPVARRTVAKYREQLHFPVARLRRQLTNKKVRKL